MTTYGIVILSYNHPELTAKTVQSVLIKSINPQRIYLVHNGSDVKFENHLRELFPAIHHASLPENKGYSGGANFGLQTAFKEFEHILFLTNDTEVVALPAEFPTQADLFSIKIKKRETEQVDSIMGQINLRTGELRHLRDLNDLENSKYIKTYVPGTAFGMSRSAFKNLGGFDQSLHTYWEDVDLSLRAHGLKIPIGYEPHFVVKHKIGKTCHKHRFYTLFLFQRNRKRILRLHSQSPIQFRLHYYSDMAKLLKQILTRPNVKTQLPLWWRAIRD